MEVKHAFEVSAEQVEGAPGVTIRWLWAAADQAPNFALRLIEVQSGASTPHHHHPYEHEVYVLSGQATLWSEAGEHPLEPGDTALVMPDEQHQFTNRGDGTLRFLCGIPLPPDEVQSINFRPIGHVDNEFNEPTKPDLLRAAESRIILDPELAEGTRGLKPGDLILILFVFHRAEGFELLQHPRGDEARPKRGVFALRSPRRPNPIGLSRAELLGIEKNVLRVRGLDAIKGTPVLDIKPA